jgi:hypothetical protein
MLRQKSSDTIIKDLAYILQTNENIFCNEIKEEKKIWQNNIQYTDIEIRYLLVNMAR